MGGMKWGQMTSHMEEPRRNIAHAGGKKKKILISAADYPCVKVRIINNSGGLCIISHCTRESVSPFKSVQFAPQYVDVIVFHVPQRTEESDNADAVGCDWSAVLFLPSVCLSFPAASGQTRPQSPEM